MAGIGTAARNWDEEQKKLQQQQQGIGTAAYHEPAGSIGTPAQNQGIGTPAYHEPAGSIGSPASRDGTMRPEDPRLSGATYQQQPIQVMQGVTNGTQQRMNQLEQGYQQTDAATAAQQALQQLMNQKPQGYTSKYGGQLEGILQQLQGQKFNYSLNNDAYWQSLKDSMTEQARQASLNAQGQAAGLTGGYGNTAAQLAGSQAYQQALIPLNDRAMDAYNLALQRYMMEQQGLGDQFNMLNALEQQNYGQYRDTVTDWQNERAFAANMYNTEEDRSYDRYMNDLNYWTQRAQIENADYRNEQERQEAIRQFEMQYAADQARFGWQQQVDQRDYDRSVLESDRNYGLQREQFDYGKQQDAQQQANWQAQFDYGKQQDALAQQNWQAQFDRNVMESDRNYELNQQQMAESIRQFNESLDWDKMSSQQKYAAEYALMMLQNGQMPSDDMLNAAGLTAEDAEKLKAQVATGGGGTGGRNIVYPDGNGNFYTMDSKGNFTRIDPTKTDMSKYYVDDSKKNNISVYLTNQAVGAVQNAVNAAAKQNNTGEKLDFSWVKKTNK